MHPQIQKIKIVSFKDLSETVWTLAYHIPIPNFIKI